MASQNSINSSMQAIDSIRKKYETIFQSDKKKTFKTAENQTDKLINAENKGNFNKYLGRYIDVRV